MCCVLQGLLKLSGSSGVVPGHTKLKELLQMLFSRTRENPSGIYFKVTFLSPVPVWNWSFVLPVQEG